MRQEIITRNIYRFEELTREQQEEIISNWDDTDINALYFEEDARELLKSIGFDNPEVSYSLSFSQSDFVGFKADKMYTDDIKQFFEKAPEQGWKLAEELNSLKRFEKPSNEVMKRADLMLYFYSVGLICMDYDEESVSIEEETQIEEFTANFRKMYSEICKELLKKAYEIIFAKPTIEEFQELCDANGYEFYENLQLV